jgi:hypothetical protein
MGFITMVINEQRSRDSKEANGTRGNSQEVCINYSNESTWKWFYLTAGNVESFMRFSTRQMIRESSEIEEKLGSKSIPKVLSTKAVDKHVETLWISIKTSRVDRYYIDLHNE